MRHALLGFRLQGVYASKSCAPLEASALLVLLPDSLLFWGTEDNPVGHLQGLLPLNATESSTNQ